MQFGISAAKSRGLSRMPLTYRRRPGFYAIAVSAASIKIYDLPVKNRLAYARINSFCPDWPASATAAYDLVRKRSSHSAMTTNASAATYSRRRHLLRHSLSLITADTKAVITNPNTSAMGAKMRTLRLIYFTQVILKFRPIF